MPDERIQLKQEEIVGNEVVLNDINPKTSTVSVDDSATGAQLDQTLDRMWNAINNKLSRIVNSVNGRTGVVVLKSSDVGLGNVDNVSFADIKQWVIDQLNIEFGNKRIKLFEHMDEVLELVVQNDLVNQNAAFFSQNGFMSTGDKKSYIGYIFLDQGTGKLSYMYMQINTVGYTDNSIIYDESVNGNDLRGGGLGVNIHKYEDALEVYNDLSGNKEESGLRINKDKIVAKLYYFDGAYGDGTLDDENALLYTNDNTSEEAKNANKVVIYFDNDPMGKVNIREHGFKVGDIIICDFKDYRDDVGNVPSNMYTGYLGRSTCIGMVTQVPSEETGTDHYIIKMYSFHQNLGAGLQYINWGTGAVSGKIDDQLTIKLASGYRPGLSANTNVSGLQLHPSKYKPDPKNVNETTDYSDLMTQSVTLPEGPITVFNDITRSDGGLAIMSDMSICMMPAAGYMKGTNNTGSKIVDNWSITSTHINSLSDTNDEPCLIGLNLVKARAEGSRNIGTLSDGQPVKSFKFANASGLRISGPGHRMSVEFLGMNGLPHTDEDGNSLDVTYYGDTTGGVPFDTLTSGGLSVNVGKFLEIEPGDYPEDSSTFYDGGKVNVRLGDGLKEQDNSNRITIKVDNENGGLGFDGAGNLIIKDYAPAVSLQSLKIVDQLGNSFTYNPSQTEVEDQPEVTLTLGPGFKIE